MLKHAGWMSATQTADYFLGDPLLSFLKANVTLTAGAAAREESALLGQGRNFEEKIVAEICRRLGKESVRQIAFSGADAHSATKFQATVAAIRERVPVIYSAVLHHAEKRTYGIADLLVRSDFIEKFIEVEVPIEREDPYYVVIDIKYSTLPLLSDGAHLANRKPYSAYKAQVLVYHQALAEIQGFFPSHAYLLGRRSSYTLRGRVFTDRHPFERLAIIDFGDRDASYITQLDEALKWLALVRTDEAKQWNYQCYPLSNPRLYPNMCNAYDNEWRPLKEEIATRNGEITALWQMGNKHRERALQEGVDSWHSRRCTPRLLGVTGKKSVAVLKRILQVNRSKSHPILPSRIAKRHCKPWLSEPRLELYVDFETWNPILGEIQEDGTIAEDQITYLIGVLDNHGRYQSFVAHRLDLESERKVTMQFAAYVKTRCRETGIHRVSCFHWSGFEKRVWNQLLQRHGCHAAVQWIDLLEYFRSVPIAVHGALSYSLKDIARALHQQGLIETTWETDEIDGFVSIVLVQKAEAKAREKGVTLAEQADLLRILRYNETDVRVLKEILEAIRERRKNE